MYAFSAVTTLGALFGHEVHPDVDDVHGASLMQSIADEPSVLRHARRPARSIPRKPLAVVDDVDIADPRRAKCACGSRTAASATPTCRLANGTFPYRGPIVLGHEAAGVVDAVGAGVTALQPGDKVVLTPVAACDECYWCLRGEYGCCVNAMAVTTVPRSTADTPLSRNGAPVFRGLGVGGFAGVRRHARVGRGARSPTTRRSRSRA